ncbi:MAG: methionyl-tRNA formyltransferase [Ruminococcaceae bacterium]|nr:methionyl-tRNA formyltransferase [Oscillospiraceae bacterium]
MRVLYMGTPDFAVPALKRIIADGHEVVAVVTQPDKQKGRGMKFVFSPVKELALTENIEVLQPVTLKDGAFEADLVRLAPDVIVVAAYGKILPEYILSYPKFGCINIHASLLPKYRGAAPIQWAIINGESETGVTAMYMEKGLDTGDMLLVKKTPIYSEDNAETLFDRLAEMGAELISETLVLAEKGELKREKQDDEKATYASMITKEMGNIDFGKTATEIFNLTRGLYPWPCAYTELAGRRVKVLSVTPYDGEKTGKKNGEIIGANGGKIFIACENGKIAITELHPENGKRMTAAAFLAGNKL